MCPHCKRQPAPIGFWDDETCEHCGGAISEKRFSLYRKAKTKSLLLENVPAGVCVDCGMRYYSAKVLKTIHEVIQGRRKATRRITVPVYSLFP